MFRTIFGSSAAKPLRKWTIKKISERKEWLWEMFKAKECAGSVTSILREL